MDRYFDKKSGFFIYFIKVILSFVSAFIFSSNYETFVYFGFTGVTNWLFLFLVGLILGRVAFVGFR